MRLLTICLTLYIYGTYVYANDGVGTTETPRDPAAERKYAAEPPLIDISSLGKVRGSRMLSASGREILAFRGVPYAEPPVGDLRFREPKAIKPWQGVIDASREAPVCLQYDDLTRAVRGSEDCLKLNIFTHDNATEGRPRPVMFWIHGGGFMLGSGNAETDFYGPTYLLDRDIVLVTINYRLGPFGFLSTEDVEAPGNYGLFDQSMALRWVKHNIRNFGGDPESITIFGESAGGASVEFHVLSPYSRGLFQRGIAQSGSLFCAWAMYSYVGQYTRLLAHHVGCPISTSREILNCLREKDATEIALFRKRISVMDNFPIAFGPRVDRESKSPFLPDDPRKLIEEKKFYAVPLMAGVTNNEGAILLESFFRNDGEVMKQFNENPQKYMRYLMNLDFHKNGDSIVNKVLERYVSLQVPFDQQLNQMEKMFSDATELYGIETSTNLFSKYSEDSVFSYIYAHSYSAGLVHPYGIVRSEGKHDWVAHGDELIMLFHKLGTPLLTDENDKKMSRIILDLWTSFAANGVPKSESLVSQWLPREENTTRYLSIETKRQMMIHRDPPYAIRMPFWDKLMNPSPGKQQLARDEL